MTDGPENMLSAASYAKLDGTSMSFFLSAIANAMLGNAASAKNDYERMADRWPAFAEDPGAILQAHNFNAELIDAFVSGHQNVLALNPQP